MAVSIFKSFLSTINPFKVSERIAETQIRLLRDPTTGAPVGVQSDKANGPDGIWGLIDLTAAQVAAPTAAMLADLNATYRLNAAPWTRYQSNGSELVIVGGASGAMDVVPANGVFGTMIIYSPFTVTQPEGVTIQGTAYVCAVPA